MESTANGSKYTLIFKKKICDYGIVIGRVIVFPLMGNGGQRFSS